MNGSELLYFPRQQFSPRFGDHIFTIDIVSHRKESIVDPICFCKKRDVILYKIIVKKGKKEWYIEKRFSELMNLFSKLKLSKYFDFTVFPSKTYFDVSNNEKYLQHREDALLVALDMVLKDLSSQGSEVIMTSEIMYMLLIDH